MAARRWGLEVGGWLVGIPFTSAPVTFFLAIGPGPHFATQASVGIMAGTLSQAAFALAYAWCARWWRWGVCLGAATAAFAAVTVMLVWVRPGALVTFAAAVVVLVGVAGGDASALRSSARRCEAPGLGHPGADGGWHGIGGRAHCSRTLARAAARRLDRPLSSVCDGTGRVLPPLAGRTIGGGRAARPAPRIVRVRGLLSHSQPASRAGRHRARVRRRDSRRPGHPGSLAVCRPAARRGLIGHSLT